MEDQLQVGDKVTRKSEYMLDPFWESACMDFRTSRHDAYTVVKRSGDEVCFTEMPYKRFATFKFRRVMANINLDDYL